MPTPGILFNGEPVDVRTLFNEDNSSTAPEPEIDEDGKWDEYLDYDDTRDYPPEYDDVDREDNDGNDYRSPRNNY